MKCKSCGAQYPDNASFCPDCGEKNDSYVQQQPAGTASADFNPQPVQNNYQPQYGNQQYYGGQSQYNPAPANTGNVKKKAKAAGKNIVMRIVISVVVFGIASAVSALYYSNKKSSGDAPATEYEQLAVDYVANLTGNADTYAFRNASAIDFTAVYDDMIDYNCTIYSYNTEDYFDYISEQYEMTITNSTELVNADVQLINESLRDAIYDEFGNFTVECTVSDVKKLETMEINQKVILADSEFAHFGKRTADYIDTAAITEAYEVSVEAVYDAEKISAEYTNVDTYYVTVAKIGNEYKVLYDDYLIDIMLTSLNEDAE